MDDKIICILSNSSVNQTEIKINPALSQKIVIYNLREISRLPQLPLQLPDSPPIMSAWDEYCLNNRTNSFKSDWDVKHITPLQMAESGFYYLGPGDRVRCLFCSVEINDWELKDDPMTEHKRVSPLCVFFPENPAYDVCGPYDCGPYEPIDRTALIQDLNVQNIQKFLNSVAIEKSLPFYGNVMYASVESRLKTFNNIKLSNNQSVRTACEAGFVYISNSDDDVMQCFCCKKGLLKSQLKDDPWTEHAIWSPACKYLLLMKGKQFVEEVRTKFGCIKNNEQQQKSYKFPVVDLNFEDNASNTVERCGDISGVIDNHSKHTEKIDEQQGADELVDDSGKIGHQLIRKFCRELSIESNSMLCKICLKEKAETMFIPCGHIISCVQCAVMLDQCAVCREPLDKILKVFVYVVEDNEKYPNKLECLSPQQAEKPVDPMLCKICHKEEMTIAFLPCRHVCACFECATKMKECPVCLESYFAILQVFL